jgi:hypothetical protein
MTWLLWAAASWTATSRGLLAQRSTHCCSGGLGGGGDLGRQAAKPVDRFRPLVL